MVSVEIYDSTLRDGAQMGGINFSLQDKLTIVKNLIDQLYIPLIEVYPYSNPKDQQLIQMISEKSHEYLDHLVAFGSTRRVNNSPDDDENLKTIVNSGLKIATIFGKSWDFHLQFIHSSPEENLEMIEDSIQYLKQYNFRVFYDAEHFFDGYKSNPDYALSTLKAAEKGGVDVIILCDTNGGTMPHDIYKIMEIVLQNTEVNLGIHAHNDSGLAVANSIAAIQTCLGKNRDCQVQGTINGLGERTGNANLTTLLPVLTLKMGLPSIPSKKLANLTAVSNLIYELSNLIPPLNQPFVGYNSFSHKGGMHIAALEKDYKSYEHINPEEVGNKRRILISEMSGKSALINKAKSFGINLDKNNLIVGKILDAIKIKESHGYTYEGADASLEIFIRGFLKDPTLGAAFYRQYFFEVDYFRVITDVRNVFHEENLEIFTDANIRTRVVNGSGKHQYHTAADGNGPVSALDKALKKSIIHFYPVLKEIELIDFKVRIANAAENEKGTSSRVRVLVETIDKDGEIWGTIGSHVNIIVASFIALLDSYVFKLMKENQKPYRIRKLENSEN